MRMGFKFISKIIIKRGQNRETQIIPLLHSFVFHNYSYA